jgi:hypothetical protein
VQGLLSIAKSAPIVGAITQSLQVVFNLYKVRLVLLVCAYVLSTLRQLMAVATSVVVTVGGEEVH